MHHNTISNIVVKRTEIVEGDNDIVNIRTEIVEGDNYIVNLRSSETYWLLKVKILFTKYFATPLFKQIKVVCVDIKVVLKRTNKCQRASDYKLEIKNNVVWQNSRTIKTLQYVKCGTAIIYL